ncbi:cupin [Streptomyces sp. HNM0575]|uniref:2,4'-dihydroxyacetophenone dioxygenase family protein n=1 Tax=Streptomyces sp. HNM0575 TaxID=2716338 RepID=UPI00145C8DAB|nr:2,4'-dihydroxyacetophenone dioxygenase family protein [Streptomyces sp. HNM0575]NLU74013.1 cupin [Streptomyces sp. HNM0575]
MTFVERTPDPGTLESGPFQGVQSPDIAADIVTVGALDLDGEPDAWVPQAENVSYRPLIFNVSNGYFVNLLRVKRNGVLSRHQHTGAVHAFNLRGRWHYLEHDWWAEEGSYVYEPPGGTHTLEVPHGVEEMITLFHVTGAYVYVDVHGTPMAVEDACTKLARARRHYEEVGLGASYADRFVR